jgi:23S rRNA pseudouridine1911/1915/1917 synthase
MELNIIYEDNELLVLNKPAGLVVHPAAGIERGTLANGLVAYLNATNHSGESLRPGIVHRLDRDTSGLMVVAKTDSCHQHLTEQFATRKVKKEYIALVYGQMKAKTEIIDLPIGRNPNHRTKMMVLSQKGRPSWSCYKLVKQWSDFALLNVEIKTGRTHQIRVHLAHIKHPVVGDEIYGPGRVNQLKNNKLVGAINNLNRQFLHAAKLAFIHPTKNEYQEFSSPLSTELTEFLSIIDIDKVQSFA